MFDKLFALWNDHLKYYILVIMIIVITGAALYAIFEVTEVLPIGVHEMSNGVTCYTFSTRISCVQVDR